MDPYEAQDERVRQVLGGEVDIDFDEGLRKFYAHLKRLLELPCGVKASRDFRWEERYVVGPGDPEEYKRLRKSQPSCQDTFELLEVTTGLESEWMLFAGEDLAAQVRRKSDGKKFLLGLAELEAVDPKSRNHELLEDYSFWFVNNR